MEKRNIHRSMTDASDFRRGRHVLSKLDVHLVFIPKYRHAVISQRVFDVLNAAWKGVCSDMRCTLRASNYEPDHVHLLVEIPPTLSISKLVNALKGVSARRLRPERFPEVTSKLWGEHFWSPSYCAVSCGGAPLQLIAQYVRNQRGSTQGAA